MVIGENIRRLRIQKGLTQAQLGNLIGISESAINRYELNQSKPTSKQLKILASVLNINPYVLLEADFNNISAMHRLFQMFRQYDGYFNDAGHLVFRKLNLSAWKHQWTNYQQKLNKAKTDKNYTKQDRITAIKAAEHDFNFWMDTYPKSDAFIRKSNNDIKISRQIQYVPNKYFKKNNIFFIKHTRFKDKYTIELRDNEHLLSYICYTVSNFCLEIEIIEKTTAARRYHSSDRHFGTKIFNALLLHLYNNKVSINRIAGKLGWTDTTRNWYNSIPFYSDFNLHLDKRLPYQLEFHLFSDSKYNNEVFLPADRSDRKNFIKRFTLEHNRSKSEASFYYKIICR